MIDRSSVLSGAIYWTLREFEIFLGWTGGAGRRPAQYEPNTRHHKGLVTYEGERKPAFYLVRDRSCAPRCTHVGGCPAWGGAPEPERLLVGGPVDPVDRRHGDRADRPEAHRVEAPLVAVRRTRSPARAGLPSS